MGTTLAGETAGARASICSSATHLILQGPEAIRLNEVTS